MKEIWKDIEGYEGYYQISNYGKVRSLDRKIPFKNTTSLKRGKVLKLNKHSNQRPYKIIELYKHNKYKKFYVHRLVGNAFIPNELNLPYINHIDANVENNVFTNLEWCTQKENIQHASKLNLLKNQKGENNNSAVLTEEEVIKYRNLYKTKKYTYKEIASKYNVKLGTMSDLLRGKTWKYLL